ncbi:Ltp family lipoprotein [Eubacterium barkeri]|uniref:Host cell surface-exposed lipoprotein n=1 Tax=Eubacterium barkeri TaxID=1528 RepID=A0A1H3ISH6_EUBBA|nr:Ltp family lipoprotein [Eubacterium barkeri]SDY30507.1 Host cell surface-exposed lipoprotein [Eubacterium barkeri]
MNQRLTVKGNLDDWMENSVTALEGLGFTEIRKFADGITTKANGATLSIRFSKSDDKINLELSGSDNLVQTYRDAVTKVFNGKPVERTSIEENSSGPNNESEKIEFIATSRVYNKFEVDENHKLWLVRVASNGKLIQSIYHYDDIVSYELMEDGESVVSGGVGRAVAGGILFGGVGAIVGGVTGKKKQKDFCRALQIKVTVRDLNKPVVYIPFISGKTKKSSSKYKEAINQAQRCLSLIEIICKEADSPQYQSEEKVPIKNVQVGKSQVNASNKSSVCTSDVAISDVKWYKKTWFTVVMLIFFWPVGLVLMWANKKFNMVARVIISVICGFILIGMITNPTSTKTTTTTSSTTQTTASQPSATAAPTPTPEPTPEITTSQKNALRSAKSYLGYTAFSYSGLISQLEYEKYSSEDATYAADNCGADWNEQAAKAAKQYLDYTSFSREGLIDQLLYEGYTEEQAEYGVNSVGL